MALALDAVPTARSAERIEPIVPRPAGPPKRFDAPAVLRIVRALVADPERTELVFELLDAVGGSGHERCFQRFAAHTEGQRLLRERPSLVDAMADREALAALPDGSFGRAYLDFAVRRDFAADGLVALNDEQNQKSGDLEHDPHRRFYFDRLTAMHDLWHVLTGYGTDEAGEATLLAFSLAQMPSRGIAVLVATAFAMLPVDWTLSAHRYLIAAYRRGRRATSLDRARYEALFALPLDEVRRRLGVTSPRDAHARGILVANRGGEARWVRA
jgi:ubiquinone biosynthesis protein COQ4